MKDRDSVQVTPSDFEPSPPLFNRELSWIQFNARVLEEGLDCTLPLLERLKFLSIFSTNLDEFFMVRVAGLKGQVRAGVADTSPDGLTPSEQLGRIAEVVSQLASDQQTCWRQLRKVLADHCKSLNLAPVPRSF